MTDAIKMVISVLTRHRGRGISEKDGVELQRQLATLLSVPIFTFSMASKHRAYCNEKATRLLLVNDLAKLAPLIATRSRGSNLVPRLFTPRCPPARNGHCQVRLVGLGGGIVLLAFEIGLHVGQRHQKAS
jgi:hypothetical protein